MYSVETERDDAVALHAVDDAYLASDSPARLLITASSQEEVDAFARLIHGGGPRAELPFVQTRAGELPVDPEALRDYCARVLDAAAGGSVLLTAVEEMPGPVQDDLIELLAGLESTRRRADEVRLISGTTVSLLDRVAAGTFSERLFYHLNVIHLRVGDGSLPVAIV